MTFRPVPNKISFPELEDQTLQYWKQNKIFEKSIETRPVDKPWIFLDGPPFITGIPHYGSLLSSIPKDLYPRFWTMRGYRVRRVWGWDCHGLPAENKVEAQLGIQRKRDIEEKVGIKTFIDACKAYVNQVSSEWEWYIDHVGRWVDFKNAYRTMDREYMESVMWVFKQMYDKSLIYKGLRISLYCPHCSTPISNFEVAMDADNYQLVSDSATTYKFKLTDQPNTYILAWSTTPWNKLVTMALAINPELTYVKVNQNNEFYILAKDTLGILSGEYEIVEEISGKNLLGLKYEPHYSFATIESGKKAYEIIGADFVTAIDGTGVVTIAAYGEDDLRVMQEQGIQVALHLDDEGHLKPEVPNWGGEYYLKVNKLVNQDLAARGLIYSDEPYEHRVPTCWRCHTRLYYAPQNAWYVNVQQLKPHMEKTNEEVYWYPEHFKHGRFLKSMQAAPDWNISRTRYWGSPVPVWECECGERIVPGSIAELEKLSGQPVPELHKPEIDEITLLCPKCAKTVHRVPEVLDSWIEAGSASFAERHFPFSGEKLENFFPPDYIIEYTGQIRAWFYVLHVIANALYDSKAFKNVNVTGVVLGTDGRKMSKNYGNYPDPKQLLQTYGGDALRLYLMGSPVMNGEDIIISEDDYRQQVRDYLIVLWNCYKFFVTYAQLDNWQPEAESLPVEQRSVLDKWLLSKLSHLQQNLTSSLEKFDTVHSVGLVKSFVTDLSNWFIRRSRDRVGEQAEHLSSDAKSFYQTLYYVLTNYLQLAAPITPFITDALYRELVPDAESIHLTDWPEIPAAWADAKLETNMELIRQIVERGHAARKEANIPVRQPLQKIEVSVKQPKLSDDLLNLVKDELNLKAVVWNEIGDEQFVGVSVALDLELTDELKAEGQARDLIRKIQLARKNAGCGLSEYVNVTLPEWPEQFTEHIKSQTLIKELTKGPELTINRIDHSL